MWKLIRRTSYSASSVFNNNLKVVSKTRGTLCKNPCYQQVSSFHFEKIHLNNGNIGDSNQSSGVARNTEKAKQLIRSKFKDVMVKAGEDVYYLDRIKLALKSDYFEKLLVNCWNEEKRDPIQIPVDSDTFSALVDVIYDERSWESLLNWDNYVTVLMAKDFLQMNDGYSTTYNYLSKNLKDLYKREQFLSLPLDHFIKTLESDREIYHDDYDDVIGQICTRWICHDLKNRLPHLAKVANAVRRRLSFRSVLEEQNIEVKLSDIDEQTKYEVVGRYIDRLLRFPNQTLIDRHAADRDKDGCFSESSEPRPRNGMKEYLENGTFYDITVIVDGKAYKLHRCILQSKSEYFQELFSTEYKEATAQCESVPDLPKKDKEYLIEGIDQATFDLLIDYIYLKKRIELSSSNIVPILKAADILRIKDLDSKCKIEVKRCIDELDSKDPNLMTLLDYLRGKKQHENLYMSYLVEHVGKFWSEEAHLGEFFSMSINTLENLLRSPEFYLDDPQEMLDICSKWIMHDVKNRYHLIPRIALAINSYGLPDYEDYKIEVPSDLANCSERTIRDQIWEIICSTSLIPVDTMPNKEPKKFEELPMFITSICEAEWFDDPKFFVAEVWNGNLDHMVTLSFTKKCRMHLCYNRLSATLIGDNLFLYCWMDGPHFLVYNLPSSKLITLNTDSRMECGVVDLFAGVSLGSDRVLLNCRDEVYCCSSKGPVLKYSLPLNRWMLFSKFESDKKGMKFASDGKELYRMYNLKSTESSWSRYVESYSFEQNAWISLPDLPSRWHDHQVVNFTTIHGHDLAILSKKAILWFDSSSQTWREIPLASGLKWSESKYDRNHSVIAQGEHEILHLFGKKLYQYSKSNKRWRLTKQIPEKFSSFFNIVAVDMPANPAGEKSV